MTPIKKSLFSHHLIMLTQTVRNLTIFIEIHKKTRNSEKKKFLRSTLVSLQGYNLGQCLVCSTVAEHRNSISSNRMACGNIRSFKSITFALPTLLLNRVLVSVILLLHHLKNQSTVASCAWARTK